MSSERVSIIEGKKPILLVAPHGYEDDDVNTAAIARSTANAVAGYAVINNGWRRAQAVHYFQEEADCNNFAHMEDVVKDEFLDPILRFRSRIVKKHGFMLMFMVHGMSNDIRQKTGEQQLDMIIGYGAGTPPSYTCEIWRKDLFIFMLAQAGLTIWQGKAGGPMSGWTRNNMNQLFRKHFADARVQTMQIEIVRDLRNDESMAELTAEYLATAMQDLLQYNTWVKPEGYSIESY